MFHIEYQQITVKPFLFVSVIFCAAKTISLPSNWSRFTCSAYLNIHEIIMITNSENKGC